MKRNVFQAVRLDYSREPHLRVSVDGKPVEGMRSFRLPNHDSFRGRRVTLPVSTDGFIPHLEIVDPEPNNSGTSAQSLLQNEQFEGVPIETFNQQQLFHYYEVGIRGRAPGTLRIYCDGAEQLQAVNLSSGTLTNKQYTDTIRVYFDPLAYGYIPHIHNTGAPANDFEVLWAKPVALPPRFYRGVRTHSEFQITYKGKVDIEWFLDGVTIGTYNFNSKTTIDGEEIFVTETKKDYFPSGTIGHVLQYKHLNPAYSIEDDEDGEGSREERGKIYIVETDVTLADLEQQTMTPQAEG